MVAAHCGSLLLDSATLTQVRPSAARTTAPAADAASAAAAVAAPCLLPIACMLVCFRSSFKIEHTCNALGDSLTYLTAAAVAGIFCADSSWHAASGVARAAGAGEAPPAPGVLLGRFP